MVLDEGQYHHRGGLDVAGGKAPACRTSLRVKIGRVGDTWDGQHLSLFPAASGERREKGGGPLAHALPGVGRAGESPIHE